MTNFEKIKEEITVEKMAKEMSDYYDCDICPCKEFCKTLLGANRCSGVFEKWLKKEVDVLDEVEKEYLKNVLAPWLKKDNLNITIEKLESLKDGGKWWLEILLAKKDSGFVEKISLPYFRSKKMYAGMEENVYYTVEELGLR